MPPPRESSVRRRMVAAMKVLFLVHGMGIHQAGWADYAIRKLDEVAGRYPQIAPVRPISAKLRIEQLVYDQVFRGQVTSWGESANALEQFAQQYQVAVPDVFTWLRAASQTEVNYFWTHFVDVLLYRFFPLIRQQVRTQVMHDLANALTPLMAGGEVVDATVLGYSLGTAVAHDALADLASRPLDGSVAFNAGSFRFENVIMVANVGKILETDYGVYASKVHPITPSTPDGYCGRYLNFRNVYDPFPWPAPFRPLWPERYFKTVDDLAYAHQFNTHALEHYLDHPAVHLPILQALFGPQVPPAEMQRAIHDYDPYPLVTRCRAAFEGFRATVDGLKQELEQHPEPSRLITVGARFLAAAQEAAGACA